MNKKAYVTPNSKCKKIEMTEILAGSVTQDTNNPPEEDDGFDASAKPALQTKNVWEDE